MENEFIPYDEALALKELGFDTICFAYYDKHQKFFPMGTVCGPDSIRFGAFVPSIQKGASDTLVAAPLYQQVFRFFREKYFLKGDVTHASSNGSFNYTVWKWNFDNQVGRWQRISVICTYNTYDEAQLTCLRKLIEISKSKEE